MATFKVTFESPADPLFTREFEYGQQFQTGETVSHKAFGYGRITDITVNDVEEDDTLLNIMVEWYGDYDPDDEHYADYVFGDRI